MAFGCNIKEQPQPIVIESLISDVTLDEFGEANVTEIHIVKFAEADLPWFNYYIIIEPDKMLSVTAIDAYIDNVPVSFLGNIDLAAGDVASQLETYKNAKGYYYVVRESGMEVGVIMPQFSAGVRNIKFVYTVQDAVVELQDTAYFAWNFVSDINTLPISNLMCTIHFARNKAGTLHNYLHQSGDCNASWRLGYDFRSISVLANNVGAHAAVQSRLLLDAGNYYMLAKNENLSASAVMKSEEQYSSDLRRAERMSYLLAIADYVFCGVAILVGIILAVAFRRRRVPFDVEAADASDPNFCALSAAEISRLHFYYSRKNGVKCSMVATVAELAVMGYVKIDTEGEVSFSVTDKEAQLPLHQALVLNWIKSACDGKTAPEEEFLRYCRKHRRQLRATFGKINKSLDEKQCTDGLRERNDRQKTVAQRIMIAFVCLGLAVVLASGFAYKYFGISFIVTGVGLLLCGVLPYVAVTSVSAPLTVKGQRYFNAVSLLLKNAETQGAEAQQTELLRAVTLLAGAGDLKKAVALVGSAAKSGDCGSDAPQSVEEQLLLACRKMVAKYGEKRVLRALATDNSKESF